MGRPLARLPPWLVLRPPGASMISQLIIAAIADYQARREAEFSGLRLRFKHDEVIRIFAREPRAALARDRSSAKDEAAVSAGIGELMLSHDVNVAEEGANGGC